MAFPVIASIVASQTSGTNTTTPTVTLPASIAAGDLIFAWVAQDGAGTFTWPSPWVELIDSANGSLYSEHLAYLIASGGETTVVPTSTVSEHSNHLAWRITAASWHGTTPPEVNAVVRGASTAPDPGSLTPSWGAADTEWMALGACDESSTSQAFTAGPTNYTNFTNNNTEVSAGVVGIASRDLNAASEDAGAFTMNLTEDWSAYMLAIRPAAGGGGAALAAVWSAASLWSASGLSETAALAGSEAAVSSWGADLSGGGAAIGAAFAAASAWNANLSTPSSGAQLDAVFADASAWSADLTPGPPGAVLAASWSDKFTPTADLSIFPVVPVVMQRVRRIQYHAVIFSPDANGGPGTPKMELDPDMLNLVWNQALNGAGQAAFTLTRFNKKLSSLNYMQDHIKIYRETAGGVRVLFAGKLVKPSEGPRDTIVYAWDYMAFLQRSRTGFKVLYPQKLIGTEIVQVEWGLAKSVADSPFAFVNTGTFENPLGLDGVTPIKTNDQFGVSDFDRLFTFYALSELSMANTSNSVVFEITREPPHTFNFWKNKGSFRTNWHAEYPGNVVDYDLNTGQDEITNDIATPIIDPTTGQQAEYVVTDPTSIAAYRRLQAAITIKTLYGITSGTTESDQQKAAAARLLTQSVVTPKLLVAFPRQGELDPFLGWDLGDTFRSVLRKDDRTGDRIDAQLRAVGIGGQWSPNAGELLQVYLR